MDKVVESCGVCMEDTSLMQLGCGHNFCNDCLTHQLAARWPGPRVTFTYLHCALCRSPLEHETLKEALETHLTLRDRVASLAQEQFTQEGLQSDLSLTLGRDPTAAEVRSHALESMAFFMCNDCQEPFCGGRVDCADLLQGDAAERKRLCPSCDWTAQGAQNDLRCFVHGHRFAIYKCDSCCSTAVWCCDGHHYCDRCHDQCDDDKHYACPGKGLCPLGIAHPPNRPANINTEMTEPSFVLGCSACLGHATEDDAQSDLGGPEGYDFGYPERDWESFGSGLQLLEAAGADEVRARLRVHAPELRVDGAAEAAERLLLQEQRWASPQALLSACGARALAHRLGAAGLEADGPALERAQRLLFLAEAVPLERLRLWDAHEALLPPRRRRLRRARPQGGSRAQPMEEAPAAAAAQAAAQKDNLTEMTRAASVPRALRSFAALTTVLVIALVCSARLLMPSLGD